MKIQIVTHLLPHELDEFERQLCVLSSYPITDDEVILDVTLNVNTVDWDNAKIPIEFFTEKFNKLQNYVTKTNWCKQALFDIDNTGKCKGINDKRRNSIRQYADAVDAFVYLDSDLVFQDYTLPYLIHCAKTVKNKYFILTPQIPKIWDGTWDHLVNSRYINNPYGSERSFNPYYGTKTISDEVTLIKSPQIKLGGGWFNLFSSNLLKYTDIPDILGPYGVDDTYVMFAAQIMKLNGEDVEQYILKNVIVAENYLLRNNPYKEFVPYKTSREDYKSIAEQNLRGCLNDFQVKHSYVLKK